MGYQVVIAVLSVIATFSVIGVWSLWRHNQEMGERMTEIEEQLIALQSLFSSHTHKETGAEPSSQPTAIMRYVQFDRRRRTQW